MIVWCLSLIGSPLDILVFESKSAAVQTQQHFVLTLGLVAVIQVGSTALLVTVPAVMTRGKIAPYISSELNFSDLRSVEKKSHDILYRKHKRYEKLSINWLCTLLFLGANPFCRTRQPAVIYRTKKKKIFIINWRLQNRRDFFFRFQSPEKCQKCKRKEKKEKTPVLKAFIYAKSFSINFALFSKIYPLRNFFVNL